MSEIALNPTPNPLALSLQHSTSYLPPSISSPSTIQSSSRLAGESLSQSLSSLQISQSLDAEEDGGASDSDDEEGGAQGVDKNGDRKVGCGVLVWKLEDGFVARANTLPTYFELNRQVRSFFSIFFIGSIQLIHPKHTIFRVVCKELGDRSHPELYPRAQLGVD